jgi:hypothetical protein
MEEAKFTALRARWERPPPDEVASPAAVSTEGQQFMAFMAARQALKTETGGGG